MTYWTGIGSRETPPEIISKMVYYGSHFAKKGYTVRSGARYIIEGIHIENGRDHWIKVAEIPDDDHKLATKIKETCEEYYGRRSN